MHTRLCLMPVMPLSALAVTEHNHPLLPQLTSIWVVLHTYTRTRTREVCK